MGRIASALVLGVIVLAIPAWALMGSDKDRSASVRIPLQHAVKAAVLALPGTAVKAAISTDEGRTVYEVTILAGSQHRVHTAYVDAQSGQILKIEK